MSCAPKVVLKLPLSSNAALEAFVEGCLRDKGELVALWGDEAPSIEDEIDWFIVSDGGVGERCIIPTAHLPKDNSFDWVVTLATQFGESKAQAQVVGP